MEKIKRWTTEFRYKKSAALLLLIVVGLVLLNNILERKNLKGINLAVNAIYEDRLLPESYIFRYYELSEKIDETLNNYSLNTQQKKGEITAIIYEIKSLDKEYLKTKLTLEESSEFDLLQHKILDLEVLNKIQNVEGLKAVIVEVRENLHNLSNIQIVEAENQMKTIRQLNGSSMINLRFEIYIIIIIALIIQALIFASRTIEVIKSRNDTSAWN